MLKSIQQIVSIPPKTTLFYPFPLAFNSIVQFLWFLKRSALFNQFLLDLQFQVDDISPAETKEHRSVCQSGSVGVEGI